MAVMVIALLVAVVLYPFAPVWAGASGTSGAWSTVGRLYTLRDGGWRTTRSVDSLGLVRGVVTVRGRGAGSRGLTATMTLQHMSWQGYPHITRVYTRPAIVVRMTRRRISTTAVTFVGTTRIPTAFPVEWAVARFAISGKGELVRTRAGVMVKGPFPRTRGNTLTVPQAHAFCRSRPTRVPNLSYAIYLHGYFVSVYYGGDGPPSGLYFDGPHKAPNLETERLPRKLWPHVVGGDGFGQPAHDGWATRRGSLDCEDNQIPHLIAQP